MKALKTLNSPLAEAKSNKSRSSERQDLGDACHLEPSLPERVKILEDQLSLKANELANFKEKVQRLEAVHASDQLTIAMLRLQLEDSLNFGIQSPHNGNFSSSSNQSREIIKENVELKTKILDLINKSSDQDRRISDLELTLLEKTQENACFTKRIRELEEKCAAPRPNHLNTSMPPSQDPGVPNKGNNIGQNDNSQNPQEVPPKKKPGAQKGHKRHLREPFKEDEAENRIIAHEEGETVICKCCGKPMERHQEKDIGKDHYEWPIVEAKKVKTTAYAYKCSNPDCKAIQYKDKPGGWKGLIIDLFLLVQILLLKSDFHTSINSIRHFLKNYAIKLCKGELNKLIKLGVAALRPAYLELLDHVKFEKILNIDETSFKSIGKTLYVWVFRSLILKVYRISNRAATTLYSVLGKNFKGGFICDYFSAYLSYHNKNPENPVQFCLVHLIRDFRNCSEHGIKEVSSFGSTGVELLQSLSHTFNQYMKIDDKTSEQALKFKEEMYGLKAKIIALALSAPESYSKSKGIKGRFQKNPECYFTFIEHLEFGPTNNPAETAIRDMVIDRLISQGSKSIEGNYTCETLWTIRQTAERLEIDLKEFLRETLVAAHNGELPPSLLNRGQPVDPKYVTAAKEEEKKRLAIMATIKNEKDKKKIWDAMRLSFDDPNMPEESTPITSAPGNTEEKASPPMPGKTAEEPTSVPSTPENKEEKAQPPATENKPEEPTPMMSAPGNKAEKATTPTPGKRPVEPPPVPPAPKIKAEKATTPTPGKKPVEPPPVPPAPKIKAGKATTPPPGKRPELSQPKNFIPNEECLKPISNAPSSRAYSLRGKAPKAPVKGHRPLARTLHKQQRALPARRIKAPDYSILEPALKGPIASAEVLNPESRGKAPLQKLRHRQPEKSEGKAKRPGRKLHIF
jgi:hypothetical protein